MSESTQRDSLRWAAYVLGHHPHAIRFWQQRIEAYCLPWDRPWDFDPLLAEMGLTLYEPPFALFEEIEVAVLKLAVNGHELPAVLTLYQRSMDRLCSLCNETSDIVSADVVLGCRKPQPEDEPFGSKYRKEIVDLTWRSRREWVAARRLAQSLFSPDTQLHDHCCIGEVLGACYLHACEPTDFSRLEMVRSLISEGGRYEDQFSRFDQFLSDFNLQPESFMADNFFMTTARIEELPAIDSEFQQSLRNGTEPPLIVIDERNRKMQYLECRFTFDEFAPVATGGFAMFLELARNPRRWMTAEDLINRAGLGADETQTTSYFSRFRRAVRRAHQPFLEKNKDFDPHLVRKAFIVEEKKRARVAEEGKSKPGPFKLDIDPILVRWNSESSR